MCPARSTVRSSALVLVWLASVGAGSAAGAQVELDCTAASADCPEVVILGDPWQEIPGVGPSPFRGYGDPSIRRSATGDRLWLSYSYLSVESNPADPSIFEAAVSVHLASSDDGGASWRFRRRLWSAEPETGASAAGGAGLSIHEVSTLAPATVGARSRWYGMHLRYFQPFGPEGRRPGSFVLQLGGGRRPAKLGRGRQVRLGGPLTDPAWNPDLDLSSLDAQLEECLAWTEPSLFARSGRLYLVAQCLVVDPLTGRRRQQSEFIGVFAADQTARVGRLDWKWIGRLTSSADARALGGQVLTQPEVTTARDGSLLLLVTPKRLRPEERHLGCRVLELESLEPAALRREPNGEAIVRASVVSSDSTGLGPGLCSYDPSSATGLLFVRTEIDLAAPDVAFRLHATGIHP